MKAGLDSAKSGGYDDSMATALRHKMTYADLVKLPPDLHRHEILEGEWFMTPAPVPDHQRVVRNIIILLDAHAEALDLGEVLGSPVDCLLSRYTVLEPDVVFVARDRAAIVRKKYIKGAPDLVVEVSSPSTAAIDRGRKLALYRRYGVREYWIVDLFARVVEVHEFGRRAVTRIHKEGQRFETACLPGLKVSVDEVFRRRRR